MNLLKNFAIILMVAITLASCAAQQGGTASESLGTPPEKSERQSPSSELDEETSQSPIDPLLVKENNLLLFQSDNKEQDIYILGTIHSSHFMKETDYSFANVQSVIDSIDPDILLVEVRQETFEAYGALDGPIDMIFAWSYAKEKGIEVKGIDWWQVTDDSKPLTTDSERDDYIFRNILPELDKNQKILILCGATHRVEQGNRFASNGYTLCQLQNIEQYFNKVPEDAFKYPSTMADEIKKKIEYLKKEGIDEIKQNTTAGSDAQDAYLMNINNLWPALNNVMNDIIIPNKLYSE